MRAIDNPDLVRATRRAEGKASTELLASHIAVVGLPYIENPEVVALITPGDLLRLRPVEDNPHDPNAVEVWHDGESSVRVGFVERQDASSIRALPHGISSWRLRVIDRSDRVLVTALEMVPEEDESRVNRDDPAQDQARASQRDDLFTQVPRPTR